MTASELGLVLLVGAAVVLAAIVAARVAHGTGLPGLLRSASTGLPGQGRRLAGWSGFARPYLADHPGRLSGYPSGVLPARSSVRSDR